MQDMRHNEKHSCHSEGNPENTIPFAIVPLPPAVPWLIEPRHLGFIHSIYISFCQPFFGNAFMYTEQPSFDPQLKAALVARRAYDLVRITALMTLLENSQVLEPPINK
jgi:hypothetical protein